jgi:molybdate transport system ATP-binding protein
MIQLQLKKQLEAPTGTMHLDIDCTIERGKMVSLYGASGAGKTSILRMIAGLMQPEHGRILVQGETCLDTDLDIRLPPQQRRMGYVFQDYALFPNMTVLENIAFALNGKKEPQKVQDLIQSFELGDLQHRKPITLSGGQKQRVALARALARRPTILMLDEPLSALDYQMRQRLQDYIMQMHRAYELTTILVSHDLGEVFRMSDEVIFLEEGKIIRQGKPNEIFSSKHANSNFQLTGEVMHIERIDVIFMITVLIGNSLVKVIAEAGEAKSLKRGDKVLVASKAFYPIIEKLQ